VTLLSLVFVNSPIFIACFLKQQNITATHLFSMDSSGKKSNCQKTESLQSFSLYASFFFFFMINELISFKAHFPFFYTRTHITHTTFENITVGNPHLILCLHAPEFRVSLRFHFLTLIEMFLLKIRSQLQEPHSLFAHMSITLATLVG